MHTWRLIGILIGLMMLTLWVTHAAPVALNAADFKTEKSTTGGIQEAIDALPPGGGLVLIPPGTNILHRPIQLKPRVKLAGAGSATVLKKDPAFQVFLAEDAKPGQRHVIVADGSQFRPDMAIAISDRKHSADLWTSMFLITNVAGNRLEFRYIRDQSGLRTDLKVADQACVMNLFMVILPASQCIIQDLEIDGNGQEQMVETASQSGFASYGMLWCGIYPCSEIKVQNCWIHDAGIGIHVNGRDVEISHCRVYNNWGDGIHCGGGPGSLITHNRIYGNQAGGITFCFGNRGIIITDNQIYENGSGINALGVGDTNNPGTWDRTTIINNNQIYRNEGDGIHSDQGPDGPVDFVFSGNIVKDNNQNGNRYLGVHRVPAGISLYNAQRCVVTGNRCLDDQDALPYRLARAAAGASNLVTAAPYMMLKEGARIAISEGDHREIQRIKSLDGMNVTLAAGLSYDYQEGADVRAVKTQPWGIFVGGPKSRDNVVADNLCEGNYIGGVLCQGAGLAVDNNIGRLGKWDESKTLEENVFPARTAVTLANPGFEESGGWTLGSSATLAAPGHSGKQALKMIKTDAKGVMDATTDYIPLKPNTRYRLMAWVKSNARKGNQVVLPYLFLYTTNAPLGPQTQRVRSFEYPAPVVAPDTWIQISAEIQTGPAPVKVRLFCRLADAAGEAWVDDIVLEELDDVDLSAAPI